jgi:hypothetical protein
MRQGIDGSPIGLMPVVVERRGPAIDVRLAAVIRASLRRITNRVPLSIRRPIRFAAFWLLVAFWVVFLPIYVVTLVASAVIRDFYLLLRSPQNGNTRARGMSSARRSAAEPGGRQERRYRLR